MLVHGSHMLNVLRAIYPDLLVEAARSRIKNLGILFWFTDLNNIFDVDEPIRIQHKIVVAAWGDPILGDILILPITTVTVEDTDGPNPENR